MECLDLDSLTEFGGVTFFKKREKNKQNSFKFTFHLLRTQIVQNLLPVYIKLDILVILLFLKH